LDDWVAAVLKVTGNVPITYLANKADLKDQVDVTEADIRRAAESHRAPYLYTSAKTGQNVEEAFAKLANLIATRSN
jgi:selenocysteine-specific translation elongation factor